jgi:hypothetical protein
MNTIDPLPWIWGTGCGVCVATIDVPAKTNRSPQMDGFAFGCASSLVLPPTRSVIARPPLQPHEPIATSSRAAIDELHQVSAGG